MDPKVLCPTINTMFRKTILALCEVNIRYDYKLEITGCLHVRSDGQKVLSCLIDEESIKALLPPIYPQTPMAPSGSQDACEEKDLSNVYSLDDSDRDLSPTPPSRVTLEHSKNGTGILCQPTNAGPVCSNSHSQPVPHSVSTVSHRLSVKDCNVDTISRPSSASSAHDFTSVQDADVNAYSHQTTTRLEQPMVTEQSTFQAVSAVTSSDVTPDSKVSASVNVSANCDSVVVVKSEPPACSTQLNVSDPITPYQAALHGLSPAFAAMSAYFPLTPTTKESLMMGNFSMSGISASSIDPSAGNKKKFQCTFCGIMLSTKCYLKNHINAVHTKARVYPCELCEKYFYSAGALRIHKLRHHWQGSKRHKCQICGELFLLPVELRRHLLKMHNIRSNSSGSLTQSFSDSGTSGETESDFPSPHLQGFASNPDNLPVFPGQEPPFSTIDKPSAGDVDEENIKDAVSEIIEGKLGVPTSGVLQNPRIPDASSIVCPPTPSTPTVSSVVPTHSV